MRDKKKRRSIFFKGWRPSHRASLRVRATRLWHYNNRSTEDTRGTLFFVNVLLAPTRRYRTLVVVLFPRLARISIPSMRSVVSLSSPPDSNPEPLQQQLSIHRPFNRSLLSALLVSSLQHPRRRQFDTLFCNTVCIMVHTSEINQPAVARAAVALFEGSSSMSYVSYTCFPGLGW